ncbi:MAG: hypothetical protein KDN05_02665 [Verrucomicrobiae bacterium]|nr:hypothetical protein [Verrucomicrobiae bacterium]
MTSLTRPSFWRAYRTLDPVVREAARRTYRRFADDPAHPSLRFKKLAGHDRIWSVRVNASVRALAEREGETVIWFWIGSHNDFDKLFG